jgi:hypothetical protein
VGRIGQQHFFEYRREILRAIWSATVTDSYAYRQPISHLNANSDGYLNANSNSYGYSHSESDTNWNANRNPYRNTE